MRIILRADATAEIGFGHLSRVAAIATAAHRAGADAVVLITRPTPGVRAWLDWRNLAFQAIDLDSGTSDDARAAACLAGPDAVVVVDGYAFRESYLRELAGDQRIVAYVDDLARERLTCDVILDGNLASASRSRLIAPHTLVLAGPSYALIQEGFALARVARTNERARDDGAVRKVLVTMGGSDPPGATLAVLEAISRLDRPRLTIRVVVGAANTRRSEITAAAAACSTHDVVLREDVQDMPEEMLWADLVVTASGVTARELACVGVPGVSFPIVDNQVETARELGARRLFIVPSMGVPTTSQLHSSIERLLESRELRAELVDAQRRTVDGAGASRVVRFLSALASSPLRR